MLSNIAASPTAAVQPRARGIARLVAKTGARGSVIQDLHQSGSAKLVFPRGGSGALQAVLVNTAGGITGGDQFDLTFQAKPNTALTVTTQAAERAYAAQTGETGKLKTTLDIGAGARLDWLPQETILFENSRFTRRLHANLATDARFLFVEPLVLGRTAMGEGLHNIAFQDRVEIYRDGKPLFMDALHLNGDAVAHMAQTATANGHAALASVVYIAPDALSHLDGVRAILPTTAGASVIGDDLLHIRCLAQDSFELRRTLVPILNRLSETSVPRVWMI